MDDAKKAEKLREIREGLEGRNWHQPTSGFRRWWEPTGFNRETGAETGGHPAAYRKCVHRETREVRHYGIKTTVAFNDKEFREEYHQWLLDGQPPREKEADGTTAKPEEVLACFAGIRKILTGSSIMSGAEKLARSEI